MSAPTRAILDAALEFPPSAGFSGDDPLALDVLRRALALYQPGLGPASGVHARADAAADPPLRAAVNRLVAAARLEDAVRAERLVLVLRQAWRTLPAVQGSAEARHRSVLWDHLVALCCEAFYAPRRGDLSAPSPRSDS